VEDYFKNRLESAKDVFGWMRKDDPDGPAALILADLSARLGSFPREVGGVRIEVKRISPPERRSC
jgi:hypothetical protein